MAQGRELRLSSKMHSALFLHIENHLIPEMGHYYRQFETALVPYLSPADIAIAAGTADILKAMERRDIVAVGEYDNLVDVLGQVGLHALQADVTQRAGEIQEQLKLETERKRKKGPRAKGRDPQKVEEIPMDSQQVDQNQGTDHGASGVQVGQQWVVNNPTNSTVNQYGNVDKVHNEYHGNPSVEVNPGILQDIAAVVRNFNLPFFKNNGCHGHVYCKQCSKNCCRCCGVGEVRLCDQCGFWKNSWKCLKCRCPVSDHIKKKCSGKNCEADQS